MRKKTRARLGLLVVAVIALLIGIGVGVITEPLPPRICATRLAQVGAPPQLIMYVCYGQLAENR